MQYVLVFCLINWLDFKGVPFDYAKNADNSLEAFCVMLTTAFMIVIYLCCSCKESSLIRSSLTFYATSKLRIGVIHMFTFNFYYYQPISIYSDGSWFETVRILHHLKSNSNGTVQRTTFCTKLHRNLVRRVLTRNEIWSYVKHSSDLPP